MVLHDAAAAAEIVERLVAPLGRRWLHVQAVVERAKQLAGGLPDADRDELISAAWLHDIGYAPELADTGLHSLDAARYLRQAGWPERIVNLVAHHSGARFEAAERGVDSSLAEFPFKDSALLDTLALADLTTGPAGEQVTYDQRINEILSRYAKDDPVHRTWRAARQTMEVAVERAVQRLNDQPR
jgi:putative nucleotidyltransferase with HDIG domain